MKTRVFSYIFLALISIVSCGQKKQDSQNDGQENAESTLSVQPTFQTDEEGLPVKQVYEQAKDKSKCFFVISKVHQEHLSVYEVQGKDTVLLACYPVCLSRDKGKKERSGDYKTPESYPGEPFSISEIKNASSWCHDFGDGRGSILAYGHWFMRLTVPGIKGIGIHGSTGNRESIRKGRDSEGCIRLLDEDIIHLHDNYAETGTKVIILNEGQEALPFEARALKRRLSAK